MVYVKMVNALLVPELVTSLSTSRPLTDGYDGGETRDQVT